MHVVSSLRRMDCQLIIHLFTYIHYHTFVAPKVPCMDGDSLLAAASLLSLEDQTRLLRLLGQQVELARAAVAGGW
jgi:hypothetical protein